MLGSEVGWELFMISFIMKITSREGQSRELVARAHVLVCVSVFFKLFILFILQIVYYMVTPSNAFDFGL